MKIKFTAAKLKTGKFRVLYVGEDMDAALAALANVPRGTIKAAVWRNPLPDKHRKFEAHEEPEPD